MKIERVTVRGFRGFNEERSVDLHPSLTLIYGPNSYGKTSITEALEWLLYGSTSKVEKGEAGKEEYKGSYRNCHLDTGVSTFVKVRFRRDGKAMEFTGELVGEDGIKRLVDGNEVDDWPLDVDLTTAPKPFVMQHALKYLLLVRPDGRFQGFARLLGLDDLGRIQSDVVSLCTKPEASVPSDVAAFRSRVGAIEGRMSTLPSLKASYGLYKKGKGSLPEFYTSVSVECKRRVPPGTSDESVLPSLLRIREDAAKKVFPGRIVLPTYTTDEKDADSADTAYFLGFATEELIKRYTELVALAAREDIMRRVEFYQLGVDLLKQAPSRCPFCGQGLSTTVVDHIQKEHRVLTEGADRSGRLQSQRQEVTDSLAELRRRLDRCQQRHMPRLEGFLAIKGSMTDLARILAPKQESYLKSVEDGVARLGEVKGGLKQRYEEAIEALQAVQQSVQQSREDAKLMRQLGERLVSYTSQAKSSVPVISGWVSPMSDANEILKHELDLAAGTEDIGVLIDLLEKRKDVEKALEIDAILEGMKDLRRIADQYVGSKMLDAITNEMSGDVMEWYSQIRTQGDPDVHFAGFDIERTKTGDLKSRRVQIKASSYGKDLVSAVSSLSESKLNALGLCMSIATNLKEGCPFGFLIIDDPIQSWDEEHATQFVEVVRKLVERGKQVVLMSHSKAWINQVRTGCRSLNGIYYEITGYTRPGPHIKQLPWCSWRQRLDEVDAILKDATADSVRLQQAEEEIRIVMAELTAEIYRKKKGTPKEPSQLNAGAVRKALVECGVQTELVDRICQTFETTDEAHHASKDYTAQRERIRRYHGWAHELANVLKPA